MYAFRQINEPVTGQSHLEPVGCSMQHVTTKSRSRRVTLMEISQHTGLSRATVSDIINRDEGDRYSPETRERVFKAVESLGYMPVRAAQQLARGRSGVIGVLLTHDFNNPFFARFASLLEKNIRSQGYRLQLVTQAGDIKSEMELIRQFRSDAVEGAIVGPVYQPLDLAHYRKALGQSLPCVLFGSLFDCEFDQVALNHKRARYLVVDHLRSMGHRRIGYIAMPLSRNAAGDFVYEHDCLEVLTEKGMARPEWIIWREDTGNFDEIQGACQEMLKRWQASPPDERPTALMCLNDQIAMVAIHVFSQAGIQIPRDVSLVGDDNLRESAFMVPPLTTIDFHIDQQAEQVLKFLRQRLETPQMARQTCIIEPSLVIRNSVLKLNS